MEPVSLQFPRPAEFGATRWRIAVSNFREWLCRVANRSGLPGAVADVHIEDTVTGQIIDIKSGVLFTRISVNGRDYYFRRFSGTFDGTGSGCG